MIDPRTSDLDFFTNLDKVNRAMQGTHDVEQMMTRVLDELLTIFNCDRATLMYPCDPEAVSYSSPMERTNPLYPGIFELGLTLPMTPSVQEFFRRVLQTDGPVTLHLGQGIDPQEEPWKTFAIQSVLGIALYPKVGPPWKLGLHQCSHERIWSAGEQKLFLEISRRLSDGLTSLLMYRNLKESESFLDNIIENIPDLVFVRDAENLNTIRVNRAVEALCGYSREELLGKGVTDFFPEEEARFIIE